MCPAENIFKQTETELERARLELARANQFLTMMIETIPFVLYQCRIGDNTGIFHISGNVLEITGYTHEAFTSDASFWYKHIHPDDRQPIAEGIRLLFEQGRHELEYRFQVADGSYRWFHDVVRLCKTEDGKPSHLAGVWLDITARKQMATNAETSVVRPA